MGLIPSHESHSPRWNLALEKMKYKCLIIKQKFLFMWINYTRTPIPRKRDSSKQKWIPVGHIPVTLIGRQPFVCL